MHVRARCCGTSGLRWNCCKKVCDLVRPASCARECAKRNDGAASASTQPTRHITLPLPVARSTQGIYPRHRSSTEKGQKMAKTYSSGYSLVVTHLTTNPPVSCLSTAERTGSAAFRILWPYVKEMLGFDPYIHSQSAKVAC